MKTVFSFTLLLSIFLYGCIKGANAIYTNKTYPFYFKGLLEKQTITSYQYGTHIISNKDKTYALKSSTINLDTYINQTVTIKGNKIKGYPVDGGPEYIDVKEVRK